MRRATMPTSGIGADNLTGAMDAGGAFAAHGLGARVRLSPVVPMPLLSRPDLGQEVQRLVVKD